MEKYIYKITNIVNGKVYIGQSIDPDKRWKQHINESRKKVQHSGLHSAISKYGEDNFIVEVIEGPTEEYNVREKYWIKYYRNIHGKTYNILDGGEEVPIVKGEKSNLALYSDRTIEEIQELLSHTDIEYQEISKTYGVSIGYLTKLNAGEIRYNDDYDYPLRSHNNERKKLILVRDVEDELLNKYISIEKICKKYGIDSSTVYRINAGKHYFSNKLLNFPIRERHCKLSNELLSNIINDLKEKNMMFSEICIKYKISRTLLSRINQGKRYVCNGVKYPIRTSKERVRG